MELHHHGIRGASDSAEAPGLRQKPFDVILRWRLAAHAAGFQAVVEAATIELLRHNDACLIPLAVGDNHLESSKSKKSAVPRTYGRMDGYAPTVGCLGRQGYCLELVPRAGRQHWQKGVPALLRRVLGRTRQS